MDNIDLTLYLYHVTDTATGLTIQQGSYGVPMVIRVIDLSGQEVDLSGCEVHVAAENGGSAGYYLATVDADSPTHATLPVQPQMTGAAGELRLAIDAVRKSGDAVQYAVQTLTCTLTIAEALAHEQMAYDNDFEALVEALEGARDATADAQAAAKAANTATDAAKAATDTARTAAGNADGATANANRATNAANGATELANNAATSANQAAGAADAAKTRANEAAAQCESIVSGDLGPAVDATLAAKYDKTGGPVKYDTYKGNAVTSVTVGGVAQPKSGMTVALPAYPDTLPANGGNADSVNFRSFIAGGFSKSGVSCNHQYGQLWYSDPVHFDFGTTLWETPYVLLSAKHSGVGSAYVAGSSKTGFDVIVWNGAKAEGNIEVTGSYIAIVSAQVKALQTAYRTLAGLPAEADVGSDPAELQEAINTLSGGEQI